jgi:hypothetical protein
VELTATLDWKTDTDDCLAAIEDKVTTIANSPYSQRQKLMLLSENVVAAAAYSSPREDLLPHQRPN